MTRRPRRSQTSARTQPGRIDSLGRGTCCRTSRPTARKRRTTSLIHPRLLEPPNRVPTGTCSHPPFCDTLRGSVVGLRTSPCCELSPRDRLSHPKMRVAPLPHTLESMGFYSRRWEPPAATRCHTTGPSRRPGRGRPSSFPSRPHLMDLNARGPVRRVLCLRMVARYDGLFPKRSPAAKLDNKCPETIQK